MRSPTVTLSRHELFFSQTAQEQQLSAKIAVRNNVRETTLSGQWEVAPHKNDLASATDTHPWISIEPKTFVGNKAKIKISIDQSKLRKDKTYHRKLLLYTNTSRKPYTVKLIITREVTSSWRSNQLHVDLLSLVFSFIVFAIGTGLCGWLWGIKVAMIFAASIILIMIPFVGLKNQGFNSVDNSDFGRMNYSITANDLDNMFAFVLYLCFIFAYLFAFLCAYFFAIAQMFTKDYSWLRARLYFLPIILGTIFGTSLGIGFNSGFQFSLIVLALISGFASLLLLVYQIADLS